MHVASAGAATGVLKTLVCHPFDVVYARLAADATPRSQPRLYSGIAHCFLQTARQDGMRAFYNGYIASTLGVVPYMATSFTVSAGQRSITTHEVFGEADTVVWPQKLR